MRLIKGRSFYKEPWYGSYHSMMDRCYREKLIKHLEGGVIMARLIDAEPYKGGRVVVNSEDYGIKIDGIKTVDAVPVKHGRWIMKKTPTGAPYTVCSHCNTSARYNDEYGMVVMNLKGANYCPNCGAKMDEKALEGAND